jgi:UDP-N-acetylmuramyl pentapeptide phosphotransferase/UDP-N-acetylglucosamine-1-phosphate transferase
MVYGAIGIIWLVFGGLLLQGFLDDFEVDGSKLGIGQSIALVLVVLIATPAIYLASGAITLIEYILSPEEPPQ